MNARLKEQIPNNYPDKQEEYLLCHTEFPHIVKEEIKDSSYNKISVCHFGTIENGNNQNAANIIDHCKCRQENFQAQRHPFTQQTEYTQ